MTVPLNLVITPTTHWSFIVFAARGEDGADDVAGTESDILMAVKLYVFAARGEDGADDVAGTESDILMAVKLYVFAASLWLRSKLTLLNRSRLNLKMELFSRIRLWNWKHRFNPRYLVHSMCKPVTLYVMLILYNLLFIC